MKEGKNHRRLTIVTWLVIFLVWYVITEFGLVSHLIIPSPKEVLNTFVDIVKNGYNGIPFWKHLGISLLRLFLASGLAIVTAVPLGLLSGYFKKVGAIVDSIVQFYRPLPPLAYYIVLILWLGIGESSKVTLLFLAAFAPIYIACVSAVKNIQLEYLLSAQSLGAKGKDLFYRIVVPACLPDIFTSIRTAVGVAYTTLVSAEMIAATSGVGWMVLDASRYLKSSVIFVGIIVMGITGVLIDLGLRTIENKIIFWKGYQ
ncbi:MAG: taurine transport system permease protein [Eubacteriaceae bacterium]|jgi:taurine transport system permease protein|nr:taurine transport system permease protein [Eubacteriaceae bacterium]MDK2903971.1 taurine transport system permease protein [Eubacteriaceae bacterium]MDK2936816.1 taurine transport system permease protein [Eubacteriaceae bacterium]